MNLGFQGEEIYDKSEKAFKTDQKILVIKESITICFSATASIVITIQVLQTPEWVQSWVHHVSISLDVGAQKAT